MGNIVSLIDRQKRAVAKLPELVFQKEHQRLDANAATYEGALAYIKTRSRQLLYSHLYLVEIETHEWGLEVSYCWIRQPQNLSWFKQKKDNRKNYSINDLKTIYVLQQYRGNKTFINHVKECGSKYFTIPQCGLTDYLEKEVGRHRLFNICDTPAYNLIQKYYGNKKSQRSQRFYMDHIDEGIFLLRQFSSSYNWHQPEKVIDAYCLHPIIQNDEDFKKNIKMLEGMDPHTVALAMEYRRVANGYLPKHGIRSAKDIELSPMWEVNRMLMSDKMQNRKDFEKYLKGKIENSNLLDQYFSAWFEALEIPADDYELYKEVTDNI